MDFRGPSGFEFAHFTIEHGAPTKRKPVQIGAFMGYLRL
jgi:hypothetical protein